MSNSRLFPYRQGTCEVSFCVSEANEESPQVNFFDSLRREWGASRHTAYPGVALFGAPDDEVANNRGRNSLFRVVANFPLGCTLHHLFLGVLDGNAPEPFYDALMEEAPEFVPIVKEFLGL